MMGFPLAHIPLPRGKKLSDLIFVFQICGILHSPFINISGKHSEIGIHKTDNSKCIKKPYSNQGQGKTYQNQNHEKTVKLVVPVSSLHKPVKLFFHSVRAFLNLILPARGVCTYLHIRLPNAAALTSILLLSLS